MEDLKKGCLFAFDLWKFILSIIIILVTWVYYGDLSKAWDSLSGIIWIVIGIAAFLALLSANK